MNCIFCRIASGEIEAKKIYEDEYVVAFHDINPQAPIHILIIPKRHIRTVLDLEHSDMEIVSAMLKAATELARQLLIAESGFRIVINTNRDAGQAVDHLHMHLLGGRPMEWPPG
jgi:histidine triad (HIT) family protein